MAVTDLGAHALKRAPRAPHGRSRTIRFVAMGLYPVAFVVSAVQVGIPADAVSLAAWFWLGAIAWDVRRPLRDHLAFARDWALPVAVLVAYTYTRGLADDLGVPVHVQMPITVDEWLGGGVLPTVRLQEWLCSPTCADLYTGGWYDALLSVVYVSHYVVALTLAGILWFRERRGWLMWIRRYLIVMACGLVCYIAYPMAPPWLAHQWGYLDTPVDRLPGRGWEGLGDLFVNVLNGPIANEVAAMPSLHAGTSVLVALFLAHRWTSRWRHLVHVYPFLMSLMLVYFGEHYVIDILAGAALAYVVHRVCAVLDRRGEPAGEPEPRPVTADR